MNVSLPHELEQYVWDEVVAPLQVGEGSRPGALRLLRQIERSSAKRQTLADAEAHELKMEVFRLPFPEDSDT